MHRKIKDLAEMWSMIGSYVLIFTIAQSTGGFSAIWPELLCLAEGRVQTIQQNSSTFLMMVPIIFGVLAIDLPCTLGLIILLQLVVKKTGKHKIREILAELKHGNLFLKFFCLTLAEELCARWLFLGQLTKIPWLSGPVGFYILFLIGNGSWALLHLTNFENSKDRHWVNGLPQFIGGFFLTYIFIKYGLLGSVLTHFAMNAIICSTCRVQNTTEVDSLIVGYSALCAFVSYWLMKKPLSDILPWFAEHPQFTLQGWGFWDYIAIDIFISCTVLAVFGLLLYDRSLPKKTDSTQSNKSRAQKVSIFLASLLLGPALLIGVYYGLYWVAGYFIANVPYRILILAILRAFMAKDSSMSGMSRTFWTTLPNVYITMCILQTLNFWPAMAYVAICSVIELPNKVLNDMDN